MFKTRLRIVLVVFGVVLGPDAFAQPPGGGGGASVTKCWITTGYINCVQHMGSTWGNYLNESCGTGAEGCDPAPSGAGQVCKATNPSTAELKTDQETWNAEHTLHSEPPPNHDGPSYPILNVQYIACTSTYLCECVMTGQNIGCGADISSPVAVANRPGPHEYAFYTLDFDAACP